MNEIENSEKLLKSLIGKTEEEAYSLCISKSYTVRITRKDSEVYMGTFDLKFDRVNLQLDDGIVSECNIG